MRRETLFLGVGVGVGALHSPYKIFSHYPVPSSAAADDLIYIIYNNSYCRLHLLLAQNFSCDTPPQDRLSVLTDRFL